MARIAQSDIVRRPCVAGTANVLFPIAKPYDTKNHRENRTKRNDGLCIHGNLLSRKPPGTTKHHSFTLAFDLFYFESGILPENVLRIALWR